MKMKLLLMALIILTSLAFISAEANPCGNDADSFLGTGKQYRNITLKQWCDNCNQVNLTEVTYPNLEVQSMNVSMVKSGINFYYNFSNTSQLECYSYTVCGDKDASFECETFWFNITPSGFTGSLGFYILIIILSLGIVVLGLYKEDAIIGLLGSFGLYFVGLYILFNGISGLKDPTYTWGIGLIILGLAAYISIKAAMELMNN